MSASLADKSKQEHEHTELHAMSESELEWMVQEACPLPEKSGLKEDPRMDFARFAISE